MRRTTMAVLVVALIVFLGALFNHNPQFARFGAKQAAIAQGASGSSSSIRVILKEWEVPTPNSHPHDPALAPDGSLWYTGQGSNTLGRLDPMNGKVQVCRNRSDAKPDHRL
jgi:streptogramin lyase